MSFRFSVPHPKQQFCYRLDQSTEKTQTLISNHVHQHFLHSVWKSLKKSHKVFAPKMTKIWEVWGSSKLSSLRSQCCKMRHFKWFSNLCGLVSISMFFGGCKFVKSASRKNARRFWASAVLFIRHLYLGNELRNYDLEPAITEKASLVGLGFSTS